MALNEFNRNVVSKEVIIKLNNQRFDYYFDRWKATIGDRQNIFTTLNYLH